MGRPGNFKPRYDGKVAPKTECACDRPMPERDKEERLVLCAKCGKVIRGLVNRTTGRWDNTQ